MNVCWMGVYIGACEEVMATEIQIDIKRSDSVSLLESDS